MTEPAAPVPAQSPPPPADRLLYGLLMGSYPSMAETPEIRWEADLPLWQWDPAELTAWQMPELLPTREWVARHVRIPSGDNVFPGPPDLNLTPYLRGIFDAFDDPTVDTITLVFGTQLGKTLAMYCMMLSATAQRPGPMLTIMPVETDAREIAGHQLLDYVEQCEPVMALAAAGRESLTREGYTFQTCSWYFGWSNSARSMGRRPCRYVYYDEVEDFPPYVGEKSNPLRIGDGRLRTFRRTVGAKSVRASSPTVEDGLLGESWGQSDQRLYWVPCHVCGEHQPLAWGQVGWPHVTTADGGSHSIDPETIERDQLAWYTCRHCSAKWSEAQKRSAVRDGLWVRDGQRVENGRVVGTAKKPRGTHAGFRLSSLYSSFTSMADLAARFVRASHGGEPDALRDFFQQELAEFFEQKVAEVRVEDIRAHAGGYALGQAPVGAMVAVAGVDVQRGYYVLSVRGWGYGMESWVLDAQVLRTEEQLHAYLRDTRLPRVSAPPPGQPWRGHRPQLLDQQKHPPLAIRMTLIDAGDDTSRIYKLCSDWRDVDIRPTVGEDHIAGAAKVTPAAIYKDPRTKRSYGRAILRYRFENMHWKDTLALLASVKDPGPGYMHLPEDLNEEWYTQFGSEKKVEERKRGVKGRSGRRRLVWKTRGAHTPNHYWDAEVLCTVATDPSLLNVRNLPDPDAPRPQQRPRYIVRLGGE